MRSQRQARPGVVPPRRRGLERPVDSKFSPDGKSLYVLDFGANRVMREAVTVFGHTGVLWRVTRKGGEVVSGGPIYVEFDEASWRGHIDNVEAWLGIVLTHQVAFRRLLEDVHPRLHEPHLREFVGEIAETARRHEAEAERFHARIGRDPSAARKRAGEAFAAARRAGAEALGSAGGGQGSWLGLHALVPANLNAESAFAVAKQLALALGLREMAEAAFAVENEQAAGHLTLKELVLETAAIAILYKAPA
ncbi:MAG: hypothetical protein LC745_08120 [Planctomycetia bacterium]|nr:hypothetical protein [Planctomycetia bacterium]